MFVFLSFSIRILDQLVTDVFGPTLKFLSNECLPSLLTDISFRTRQSNQVALGIQEVSNFLKILSSLLSKYFLREDLEKKIKRVDEEGTYQVVLASKLVPLFSCHATIECKTYMYSSAEIS